MKLIDRETVQKILDTADIVEVVSDFVSLKKQGSNYIGLCPFHNERTPSFSVSRAKGICKCFSCGKGGSPLNFIMEHEQMTYYEALRYLAKKYHIEIKEREMTDQERQQASEREAMMAVNEFAMGHFMHNLKDTPDGREIGAAYFRERGINDQMIERFKLGYSPERPDDLYRAALAKGYEEKYLVETGLCTRSEQGKVYDRFRGRVIYPVFTVSGRVVAFGARTLSSGKVTAKYLNSPQSLIYNKSHEIYGLYQAKAEIVKRNKCILVEGYMDVISMHQAGVSNVVASSGTSLTDGQVRLIHRFTENVTLIYDSDAAGIKASLRGIDLLLAEGLNIKVLLLPDGEDPDSFAQHHSSLEVEEYIKTHETDFLRFKTSILLKDAENDPIARARVINDIIRSISVIPDTIVRAEYIKECSRTLQIGEQTLMLQLQKAMADNVQKQASKRYQAQSGDADATNANGADGPESGRAANGQDDQGLKAPYKAQSNKMHKCEEALIRLIVRYGMVRLDDGNNDDGVPVLDYIWGELDRDGLKFADPVFARIFTGAIDLYENHWASDLDAHKKTLLAECDEAKAQGVEDIRRKGSDLAEMQKLERQLYEECDARYAEALDDYAMRYLRDVFLSSADNGVRDCATSLAEERYTLSRVHTRYAHIETERERLADLVPRAVFELKLCVLNERIEDVFASLKSCGDDPERTISLMQQQKHLYEMRSQLAKCLGDRIVTPPKG